ncbi:MAG: HAMP domain-containing histidine kinase [bacterium]|nr:HAMP domain-containing histidine kinase [bacterium]
MSSERIRFLLQLYVFIGSLILLLMAVLYVRHLNERARNESNFGSEVIVEMLALHLESEDIENTGPRLRNLLNEIATEAPFPLIITDLSGRPIFWKVEGVEFMKTYEEEDFEYLQHQDIDNPTDPGLALLISMSREFREAGQSVVFHQPGMLMQPQGYICFGQSDLAEALGRAIVIQLVMMLVFFFVGILGFFLMKRYEQESIWVGLAKETAHQMGTPLTSLLGWIQLSEARLEPEVPGLPISDGDKAILSAMSEMSSDVERLQKVSARFNNIGGSPQLKRDDLQPVVARTAEYFRRRLPHLKVQVEIKEQYDEVPMIKFHMELIEWVIENLIKNALDSMDKTQGVIGLTLAYNATERTVDLQVRDNGRGMTPSQRRKIFRPGYSTKSAGWGLGLTLSRRLVEEYHDGRLRLLDSHEGHGTCFVIRLPV